MPLLRKGAKTSMRFMTMVKADKAYEAGQAPNAALDAAIVKLAEESFRSGVMVEMGGLLPTAKGARVRVSGGKMTVTDGPFTEIKELIGGYAILNVGSKEEAIEHTRRFLQLHVDVLGKEYEGECEVRQMFEPGM
ncbi:MAG: transcriptional regulator [Bryobacterales bacterium]|nr:transcriptional regulator [Bryobacterales bacterium]